MVCQRAQSARQKALDLAEKRDAMEAEINSLYSSLTENGGPGLTGNLVDAQGFPRSDIDVHGIRIQRNRFATLKTDHRLITAEIEKQMHIALAPPTNGNQSNNHTGMATASAEAATTNYVAVTPASSAGAPSVSTISDGPSADTSASGAPSAAIANGSPTVARRVPFAEVDVVETSSPAATADLRIGDKIVSFGEVSIHLFSTPRMAMGALPRLLTEHENRAVEVVVERKGDEEGQSLVTLQLTPQRWSGQGLLGCHVVPLDVSQLDDRYRPDVATATQLHSNTMPSHV